MSILLHPITFKHCRKKEALNLPRLILLSILDLVSDKPSAFNRLANSVFVTPLLISSDFKILFAFVDNLDIRHISMFANMQIIR